MVQRIHILNGPNLNLLGTRESDIYGSLSLADLEALCRAECDRLGFACEFAQTNHEGELVTLVQQAEGDHGIVLNAGAYSHTSIAIHDAIRAISIPVVEVHLSNVFAREGFRHHSTISPVAIGMICGLGPTGYKLAIAALAEQR